MNMAICMARKNCLNHFKAKAPAGVRRGNRQPRCRLKVAISTRTTRTIKTASRRNRASPFAWKQTKLQRCAVFSSTSKWNRKCKRRLTRNLKNSDRKLIFSRKSHQTWRGLQVLTDRLSLMQTFQVRIYGSYTKSIILLKGSDMKLIPELKS